MKLEQAQFHRGQNDYSQCYLLRVSFPQEKKKRVSAEISEQGYLLLNASQTVALNSSIKMCSTTIKTSFIF